MRLPGVRFARLGTRFGTWIGPTLIPEQRCLLAGNRDTPEATSLPARSGRGASTWFWRGAGRDPARGGVPLWFGRGVPRWWRVAQPSGVSGYTETVTCRYVAGI